MTGVAHGDNDSVFGVCHRLVFARWGLKAYPRPISGNAGSDGNLIGFFGGSQGLQNSRRLILSSLGKSIRCLTGCSSGVRRFTHGGGLHLGGIGASLNGSELVDTICGQVTCCEGLGSSRSSQTLSRSGLGLPG